MTNGTRKDSEHRKVQRLFEKFAMHLQDIGFIVLSQITKPKKGWTLSMDRTKWKFVKTHINIPWIQLINATFDGQEVVC